MRKFHHSPFGLLVAIVMLAALPLTSIADNTTITYQGRLLDSDGAPVNDTVSMTFKIYVTGGFLQWTSVRDVPVENGIYSIQLGEINSLASVDFGQTLELGVTVGTDTEMTPRQQLSSVNHAHKAFTADFATTAVSADSATTAGDADTLDSLDSTEFVLKSETEIISSAMILNGTIAGEDLELNTVGTNQITNGTIRDDDLGINSVGSSQLKNDAVHSSEIVDGTITAADLADDYVNTTGDTMSGGLAVVNTGTTATYGNSRVKSQAALDTYGLLAIPQATNDFEVDSADWPSYEIGVAGISVGTTSPADNYGVMGHANNVGVRGEYSGDPQANYGELGKSGVGVFGKGSVWAGQFDGAVNADSLEVAGEYRYTTPRTHYYQMSPIEFFSEQLSDYCKTISRGWTCNDANINTIINAPLHLPRNAVITSLRVYFSDSDSANGWNVGASVYRRLPTSLSRDLMARIETGTTEGFSSATIQQSTDTTIEDATISENYQYTVQMFLTKIPVNTSIITDKLGFHGVRIAYTMDTVAP